MNARERMDQQFHNPRPATDEEVAHMRMRMDDYGADNVWTTRELTEQFEVHSFLAPFVFATRKSDGVDGTLMFDGSPRVYFNFVAKGD